MKKISLITPLLMLLAVVLFILHWTLGFRAFTTYSYTLLRAGTPPYNTPNLKLTNQHGKKFSLADLQGKYCLVNFIYLKCATVCPVGQMNMQSIYKNLPQLIPQKLQLLSISFDIERDTVPQLKEAWENHGSLEGWQVALPTQENRHLQETFNSFGVWINRDRLGQFNHTSYFFLLNPQGQVVKVFNSDQRVVIEQGLRQEIKW